MTGEMMPAIQIVLANSLIALADFADLPRIGIIFQLSLGISMRMH
jgi:hypothetical protein